MFITNCTNCLLLDKKKIKKNIFLNSFVSGKKFSICYHKLQKKSFTEQKIEGVIQTTDTIGDKLGLKIYEFLLKIEKYNWSTQKYAN